MSSPRRKLHNGLPAPGAPGARLSRRATYAYAQACLALLERCGADLAAIQANGVERAARDLVRQYGLLSIDGSGNALAIVRLQATLEKRLTKWYAQQATRAAQPSLADALAKVQGR